MKNFTKIFVLILLVPILLVVFLLIIPVLILLMTLFGLFTGRRWVGGSMNWRSSTSHRPEKNVNPEDAAPRTPEAAGPAYDVECEVLGATTVPEKGDSQDGQQQSGRALHQ